MFKKGEGCPGGVAMKEITIEELEKRLEKAEIRELDLIAHNGSHNLKIIYKKRILRLKKQIKKLKLEGDNGK